MTRLEVFEIVKKHLLHVMEDLDPARVEEDKSMKDLGANSIDRADVIIRTMEQLGIKLKISELADVKNLRGLVDILFEKVRVEEQLLLGQHEPPWR
jgi:polyketide biosynthesis acyl carrier protein